MGNLSQSINKRQRTVDKSTDQKGTADKSTDQKIKETYKASF